MPQYTPNSNEWVIIAQTQLFDILMQEEDVNFSHNFQGAEGEYSSYSMSPPYSPSSTEWVTVTQTQLFDTLMQEEYVHFSLEQIRSNRRLYNTHLFLAR